MAGNKISMLAIVSSTPEQFWRYAVRIALPNSRRPHSEADFVCQRMFCGDEELSRMIAKSSFRRTSAWLKRGLLQRVQRENIVRNVIKFVLACNSQDGKILRPSFLKFA